MGIKLRPNAQTVLWNRVNWSNGSGLPLVLYGGEGWFDTNGILRLFSIEHPDGSSVNCHLLPRNQPRDIVLQIVQEILLPFGMMVAGQKIISGSTVIHMVARKLATKYAEVVIADYLSEVRLSNSDYYSMETGRLWVTGPLEADDV
jgi:hypothetical protein